MAIIKEPEVADEIELRYCHATQLADLELNVVEAGCGRELRRLAASTLFNSC